MTVILRLISCYWGKGPRVPLGASAWHPLVLHAFDVAAVADCLMTTYPRWLARVAAALCMSRDDARRLVLWLVVLHDLGKFAGNFQIRVAELAALLGFSARDYGSPARHDVVGLAMADQLHGALHARTVGRVSQALEASHLFILLSATTGHHGMPRPYDVMARECWNAAQLADARDFADATWIFFGGDQIALVPEAALDGAAFSAATWDIAGLTIAADWLGSKTDWFPYASTDAVQAGARAVPTTDEELRQYWHDAQRRASIAVNESGLCRAEASTFDVCHVVDKHTPRPAQLAAAELALPAGGSLTILEDQTGSGKTEAALIVLHRLMAAGLVDGLFSALPTQATANAQYERNRRIVPQLVCDPERASMVLSHSARDYQRAFRDAFAPSRNSEQTMPGEAEPASVGYTAWLAESNKRALLAQFGVGTIDQSLMTVLRSKHQALRLFGLDGKLLLVDEVHAYDSYQAQALKTLLTRIAARGGHVVLLSATLPKAQRQGFVDAFARGLRASGVRPRGGAPSVIRDGYPLLTRLDASGLVEIPVAAATRPHAYRIRYVSDPDAVVDHIVAAAEAGKAVVWIRNTVADARDAYARLRERLPEQLRERLELFHARFALGDRSRIEERVNKHFGAKSNAENRAGRVLIATQVIEQSLDVDFDEMVTDIAPIDLLIQRAGRLHRHRRDAAGNRIDDPDARGEAELVVFGPPFADDAGADWVSGWSRGTAFVYDNHAYLWRTVRELGDRLDLGAAPRRAIEAVYDACDDDYPKALQRSAFKAESAGHGDRTMAGFNTIKDSAAYEYDGLAWPDDMTAPTRLGERTVEIALARVCDGGIVPWSDDKDEPWAMSVVRVRYGSLGVESATVALMPSLDVLRAQEPALRWRHVFLLERCNGRWISQRIATPDGQVLTCAKPWIYDDKEGLRSMRSADLIPSRDGYVPDT